MNLTLLWEIVNGFVLEKRYFNIAHKNGEGLHGVLADPRYDYFNAFKIMKINKCSLDNVNRVEKKEKLKNTILFKEEKQKNI